MSSLIKLPIIRTFYNRYVQKRSNYLKDNREEVLFLYRRLRKAIPPTIGRELMRQAKIKELKWLFEQSKNERFIENIEYSKNVAYTVLEKIEKGEYPPYPTYYPNPNIWYNKLNDEEAFYLK